MKNRVLRVLPALLHQTVGRASQVLDEAIAIAVTIAVDPFQGAFDVRPDRRDERTVPGPFQIRTGQDDEKRRRIDAAVVTAERYFPEPGHFATASLMENLPRLGILLDVERIGLSRCQVPQYAACDSRV